MNLNFETSGSDCSNCCLLFCSVLYKQPLYFVGHDIKVQVNIEIQLHGLSMFSVKTKIYGVSIINPVLWLLMKHLVIGQHQKAPNFLAFHWSPHSSLVSIGQHFVITNIDTKIEIEGDLNTESNQAVRCSGV